MKPNCLLLVGLVALPSVAQAESSFEHDLAREVAVPGGLTARQVTSRASSASHTVSARRAEVEAAAAGVDRALSAYLPRVTLSGRYARLSDPGTSEASNIVVAPGSPAGPLPPGAPLVNAPLSFPVLRNQWSFQASLGVPLSDYVTRFGDLHTGARLGREASEHGLAASERAARAEAAIAYFTWVRARLSVLVAGRALDQARAHLADAKVAEEVGSVSHADVWRVKSQVARAELLVASTKSLSRVAEEQLRLLLGDPPDTRYRIGDDPRALPVPIASASKAALFGRALARRPELAGLRAAATAKRSAARAERAAYLPRIDGFANYYYQNPSSRAFPQRDRFQSSWDAGLVATWVVSDIPGARAAAQGEEASARALDAERAALEDRVRLEVTRARQDALAADAALATTAEGLAAAEEAHRARRAAFQSGKATSTELLDADTDLTRARFESLGARIDARIARVRLAFALGDDLDR